jgi:4-oxalocrotonate tautomerase
MPAGSGHPVRRAVKIERKRRGTLDHPLSRMMTTMQGCSRKSKGETRMPEITISMAAGRTDEQKAGMMRDITQALVKNLGVDADAVVIQINEAPLAHKMKGGKTFVERAAAAKK